MDNGKCTRVHKYKYKKDRGLLEEKSKRTTYGQVDQT